MATMTIIKPDGSREENKRNPSDRPTLEELQSAVGGYIEAVDAYIIQDNKYAYANEEGRLQNLPVNMEGTKAVKWPYAIVGNVVTQASKDSFANALSIADSTAPPTAGGGLLAIAQGPISVRREGRRIAS